jgi:hypothetical protein
LIFEALGLEKLKPKVARLGSAQAWFLLTLSITRICHETGNAALRRKNQIDLFSIFPV